MNENQTENNNLTENDQNKNITNLSNTMPTFNTNKYNYKSLLTTNNFKGFFNKNFNLTSYHKLREESRSHSKSPEKIYIPHKLKGNGIPNKLLDRLNFLKSIFNSKKFLDFYKEIEEKFNVDKNKKPSLNEISDFILNYNDIHGEIDQFAMIFYFICNYLEYDVNINEFKKENKTEQKAENVYRKKKGLSEGFCNLFEYFCKKKNLRFRRINGYSKFLNFNEKNSSIFNSSIFNSTSFISTTNKLTSNNKILENNHCWNAIFIKGKWYFIDCLMGSGGTIEKFNNLPGNNSKNNFFNPFYFLTPPEYLIITHIPYNDDWQYIPKTINDVQFMRRQFLNLGEFYKSIYDKNISFLSHDYPLITHYEKENLIIKLKSEDIIIQAELFYKQKNSKISEVKISSDDDDFNMILIEPSFPIFGEYNLIISARDVDSNEIIYNKLLEYHIKIKDNSKFNYFEKYKEKINFYRNKRPETFVALPKLNLNRDFNLNQHLNQPKIINDYSKIFPSKNNKKICFDNDNSYIIEPRNLVLRVGEDFKFKIRVKNANHVCVVDGRKFNFLRRTDENTFEGQVEINNENVCLCCNRNNVFTEIYRFKVIKSNLINRKFRRSIL